MNFYDKLMGWQLALAMAGIIVDKVTEDSIYLSIPKDSYEYEMGATVDTPDKYAKSISEKGKILGFIPNDFKVKYKIYDIYWTKEMSKKARENFHIAMKGD